MSEFDFLFKIVLVGDSGVGKSNCSCFFNVGILELTASQMTLVLSRFTKDLFRAETRSTIGVEFSTRSIEVDGKVIKAQIWDTAGQERFGAITTAYFRGAVGALIVFDVTNRVTYENIAKWLRDLRERADPEILVMLVGNKTDLVDKRVVSKEEAMSLAVENEISYVETSALDASNVELAFTTVLSDIFHMTARNKLMQPDEPINPPTNTLSIASIQQASQSKCCT